jgi:hypothetical protein
MLANVPAQWHIDHRTILLEGLTLHYSKFSDEFKEVVKAELYCENMAHYASWMTSFTLQTPELCTRDHLELLRNAHPEDAVERMMLNTALNNLDDFCSTRLRGPSFTK